MRAPTLLLCPPLGSLLLLQHLLPARSQLRALGLGDYSTLELLDLFCKTILPSRPPAELTAFLNRCLVDSIDAYFMLALSADGAGDAGLDEIALFAAYFDLRPTVYLSAGSVRARPQHHPCAHVLRHPPAARWPHAARPAARWPHAAPITPPQRGCQGFLVDYTDAQPFFNGSAAPEGRNGTLGYCLEYHHWRSVVDADSKLAPVDAPPGPLPPPNPFFSTVVAPKMLAAPHIAPARSPMPRKDSVGGGDSPPAGSSSRFTFPSAVESPSSSFPFHQFHSLPIDEAIDFLLAYVSGPQVLEQGNDALTTSLCTCLSRKIPAMNEVDVASNLDSMCRLQRALSRCPRSDVPSLTRLHSCFSYALSSFSRNVSLGDTSALTASLASLTSPSRQADLGFANDSGEEAVGADGDDPFGEAFDDLDDLPDDCDEPPVGPLPEGDLNVQAQAPSAEVGPSDSQTGQSGAAGVRWQCGSAQTQPAAAILEAARTAAGDNGLSDSAAGELALVVECLIRKVERAMIVSRTVSCTICGRIVSTKALAGYCMKPGAPACRLHTLRSLDAASQHLIYEQVCQDRDAAHLSRRVCTDHLSRRCQKAAVAADCSSHKASEAALQCALTLGLVAPLDADALTSIVKAVMSAESAFRVTDEALHALSVKSARAKLLREAREVAVAQQGPTEASTEAADPTQPVVSKGMAGRFYCVRCNGYYPNGKHKTGSDRCDRALRASSKASKAAAMAADSTPSPSTCPLCHRRDGSGASGTSRARACGQLGDAKCCRTFQAMLPMAAHVQGSNGTRPRLQPDLAYEGLGWDQRAAVPAIHCSAGTAGWGPQVEGLGGGLGRGGGGPYPAYQPRETSRVLTICAPPL